MHASQTLLIVLQSRLRGRRRKEENWQIVCRLRMRFFVIFPVILPRVGDRLVLRRDLRTASSGAVLRPLAPFNEGSVYACTPGCARGGTPENGRLRSRDGPHKSRKSVFDKYISKGGWYNMGIS